MIAKLYFITKYTYYPTSFKLDNVKISLSGIEIVEVVKALGILVVIGVRVGAVRGGGELTCLEATLVASQYCRFVICFGAS